jgi:hypothetical protein
MLLKPYQFCIQFQSRNLLLVQYSQIGFWQILILLGFCYPYQSLCTFKLDPMIFGSFPSLITLNFGSFIHNRSQEI